MEAQETRTRGSAAPAGRRRPADARAGRGRGPAQTSEARVAAVMAAHGEALRRLARRYSAGAEDAEDALQRGLEIYLRRLARVDPATEVAWLKVVVKHEALAVRRTRREAVAGEDADLDAQPAPDQRSLEDLLAGRERGRRVAEALRRLKPDEARALLLRADGLSYQEIGERMAWSYTKVNRCLTEGRKRFFELYAEIEAGEACARVAPALHALAGGHATAATLLELRPHLRHCAACRAGVRRLHAAQPFSAPRTKAPTMKRWSTTKSTIAGNTAMTLPAARMPVELVA
jgi:RNA polymerase sigma factor (sigma-70 family)